MRKHTPGSASERDSWLCADFDLLDYREARDLQLRILSARACGIIESDIILFMEHAPVFTLGRRGGRENLKVPEPFLEEARIPIVHAERGGDITFHGPGQLVGYPILDLRASKMTVAGYVERLEEIMIRTAAHWGINAARSPLNHGVWVGDRKLGSLGIAVRRGIAFHGFALNVNVSLGPFDLINPCGLHGIKMTSVETEVGYLMRDIGNRSGSSGTPHPRTSAGPAATSDPAVAAGGPGLRAPSVKEVRERIKSNIEEVFNVRLDLAVPPSCRMPCLDLLDRK